MSFKSYLQESFNMTHLEDSVLSSQKDAIFASDLIVTLVNDLTGASKSKVNITVKWDGSPAFIYGPHPDNGKPFITTKGRLLKKEPQVFQSVREIKAAGLDAGLVTILADMFVHLGKLRFKRVLMGDLIFNQSMKKNKKIDGEAHLFFQPNTIAYAVPLNTELGKNMSKAKIGVIFHTSWSGKDLKSFKKKVETKIENLGQHKDVYYDDATFKEMSGTALFTASEAKGFAKAAIILKRSIAKLDHSVLKPTVKAEFSRYFNQHLKAGRVPPVTIDSFLDSDRFSDKMRQHITDNKGKLQAIFDVFLTLGNLKIQIVRKLESIESMKTFVKDGRGFKVTKPEGFVAIDRDGRTVKLVDRLTFSANNFKGRP